MANHVHVLVLPKEPLTDVNYFFERVASPRALTTTISPRGQVF
jgi:hypothetical protein